MADLEEVRQTFEAKRRKLARTLLARDVTEGSAGGVVALAFAAIGWNMKTAGLPIAVAVLLILGVTGFFIRERIRARGQRVGPAAPLLVRLDAEIDELRHQRRLLWNVWPWYLGPIVVAWTIVGATMLANAGPIGRETLRSRFGVIALGGYVAFCAVLFWATWAMNRRAVRKTVDPRLLELEKLRAALVSAGTAMPPEEAT